MTDDYPVSLISGSWYCWLIGLHAGSLSYDLQGHLNKKEALLSIKTQMTYLP